MKVLVTGGSGLVGKAIQHITDNDGSAEFIFASSQDVDLINTTETIKFFETHKPDIVIHLAAVVGGLYKNMDNNLQMYNKNLIMNTNVIECCHVYRVKKSIFCLSTCIFPDINENTPWLRYPISELDLHKGPPHPSNKGYSYAKRMIQVHTELYNDYYIKNNMPNRMICIIPTNVYGPFDNFDLKNGHAIAGLIHQCYLAAKNNVDFLVKGTGAPLRQFIYSMDLAKLIIWVVHNFEGTEHSNSIILSPPAEHEISIANVAEIIKDIFEKYYNTSISLKFDSTYSDGQYKKTADNTLLTGLISDSKFNVKFTDIKIGLKETINWFILSYDKIRK